MHTQTVKRGFKNEYSLLIASIKEGASEHDHGSVSHVIGTEEVIIRSTSRSCGSIPIEGKENIKLLRDAIIAICEMEGIE